MPTAILKNPQDFIKEKMVQEKNTFDNPLKKPISFELYKKQGLPCTFSYAHAGGGGNVVFGMTIAFPKFQ
jgi:hypothetical protein